MKQGLMKSESFSECTIHLL